MHTTTESARRVEDARPARLAINLVLGIFFGIVLIKSEVVSWFRIQEMFLLSGIHMYGIFALGVLFAGVSVALIRRAGLRTVFGEEITIKEKDWNRGHSQALGGILFGLGWSLLGACPGPLYALIGSGVTVMAVALLSAVAGAWAYGHLRPRLPH